MAGAAWNTKKKTPEQEFEDSINKNEYYDILTTEECLIKIDETVGMSAEKVGCTGLLNQLRDKL